MSPNIVMTVAALSVAAFVNAAEKPVWVYLGSYAKGPEQGITLCELDRGTQGKGKGVRGHSNPSFHNSSFEEVLYARNRELRAKRRARSRPFHRP